MIRYMLKCCDGHSFESWFKSASAFEALQADGRLSCPHCGVDDVHKSLMAPQVSTARKALDAADQDSAPQAAPEQPKAIAPTQDATPDTAPDPEAALAAMRDHLEQNADYVGADFTKQARDMNNGDTPARSIYGEAKAEDAKALIEEGVPVLPLPFLPKRKLN
ncbi:MAG: DUF1178 family protein [Pacificibacter sp.]|uniref:DUF1178 family protein n=1 Tax=Pacificibacter sp. TaxID=1917866 RepID=UPI00321BBE32